jgi:hypothetical protein
MLTRAAGPAWVNGWVRADPHEGHEGLAGIDPCEGCGGTLLARSSSLTDGLLRLLLDDHPMSCA